MKTTTAVVIAQIVCASLAWGYTNPIENQTTETIYDDTWDLGEAKLFVGRTTPGNGMRIVHGGIVTNQNDSYIGYDVASSNNTVLVTGTDSIWHSTEIITLGQSGQGNSLTLEAGGRINSGGFRIGWNSHGHDNQATISGASTVWSNSGWFALGWVGHNNTLTISEGGTLQNPFSAAEIRSSNNTAIVTGPGSSWSLNILYLGYSGYGHNLLSITNGGMVTNSTAYVGFAYTSESNRVEVTGSGSRWDSSGDIYIGHKTLRKGNNVSVSAGGRVQCADQLYIGDEGSGNELTVSSGGLVQCSSTVWLGYEDSHNNSASITAGGRVETGNGCIIGGGIYSYATNNSVTVSGAGSVWSNQGNFVVGSYGRKNSLTIADGGRVLTTDGYIGSETIAKENTATVTGAGSVWSNSNRLSVGYRSEDNRLYITDGGRVECLDGHLGYSGRNNNKATISGTNSAWNCSGHLYIGGNSSSTYGSGCSITLTNGGMVSAAAGTIYPNHSAILQPGGTLALSSNLTASTSNAKIQIGINSSGHGKMNVGGLASLGGILDVALQDGYSPASGATFNLFDWNGGVSGTFGTVNLPALPFGLAWQTSQLYSTGELIVELSGGDSDGDTIADGWEYRYFNGNCTTNGNPDLDPHNNLAEYIAGTDPTNGASFLSITNAWQDVAGHVVEWAPTVSNRDYSIHWKNSLTNGFQALEPGIEWPQSSATDTTHNGESEGFYRIEVELK